MDELKKIFDKFGMDFDDDKKDKYISYMEKILEKNQSVNLTAITERDEFIGKHYIDSLLCAGSKEFAGSKRIVDVGTGGGFPGIPLAIAFPERDFVLLDSLNKRIKIVKEAARDSGIENISAFHGRAEDFARNKDMREKFDLCVSRAVAHMSTLCEYCLPFVKVGGCFIAYKGPECEEEIEEAKKAISLMGGRIDRTEVPEIQSGGAKHTLIFISKIKNTMSKYPRKAGIPSKEPVK